MVVLFISFFMATKTTTLTPPSLSAVLKSNTVQSAPQTNTSTPSTTNTQATTTYTLPPEPVRGNPKYTE